MEINEKYVRELIEVYKKHYNMDVTPTEAAAMLRRYINLFEQLVRSEARRRLADNKDASNRQP